MILYTALEPSFGTSALFINCYDIDRRGDRGEFRDKFHHENKNEIITTANIYSPMMDSI